VVVAVRVLEKVAVELFEVMVKDEEPLAVVLLSVVKVSVKVLIVVVVVIILQSG
jgi:hypothetical protein